PAPEKGLRAEQSRLEIEPRPPQVAVPIRRPETESRHEPVPWAREPEVAVFSPQRNPGLRTSQSSYLRSCWGASEEPRGKCLGASAFLGSEHLDPRPHATPHASWLRIGVTRFGFSFRSSATMLDSRPDDACLLSYAVSTRWRSTSSIPSSNRSSTRPFGVTIESGTRASRTTKTAVWRVSGLPSSRATSGAPPARFTRRRAAPAPLFARWCAASGASPHHPWCGR